MKAHICLDKCRMAETIFNRSTKLNQDVAGNFINNCLAKVGIADFRVYSLNDEKNSTE